MPGLGYIDHYNNMATYASRFASSAQKLTDLCQGKDVEMGTITSADDKIKILKEDVLYQLGHMIAESSSAYFSVSAGSEARSQAKRLFAALSLEQELVSKVMDIFDNELFSSIELHKGDFQEHLHGFVDTFSRNTENSLKGLKRIGALSKRDRNKLRNKKESVVTNTLKGYLGAGSRLRGEFREINEWFDDHANPSASDRGSTEHMSQGGGD